jgi:mRNA interferase HicA
MKSSEFKRWLTKLGATFVSGKGSHLHVFLNGRRSILPMHNRELSTVVFNRIRKDLDLKDEGGK